MEIRIVINDERGLVEVTEDKGKKRVALDVRDVVNGATIAQVVQGEIQAYALKKRQEQINKLEKAQKSKSKRQVNGAIKKIKGRR